MKTMLLIMVAAAAVHPTCALAQASIQTGTKIGTLPSAPAVGLGLAGSSPSPTASTASVAARASAGAAAGQVGQIPGRFSPRKVCVYNLGVAVNGSARAAVIRNNVDLRNVRMECR